MASETLSSYTACTFCLIGGERHSLYKNLQLQYLLLLYLVTPLFSGTEATNMVPMVQRDTELIYLS